MKLSWLRAGERKHIPPLIYSVGKNTLSPGSGTDERGKMDSREEKRICGEVGGQADLQDACRVTDVFGLSASTCPNNACPACRLLAHVHGLSGIVRQLPQGQASPHLTHPAGTAFDPLA